jgi:hypothetical protein
MKKTDTMDLIVNQKRYSYSEEAMELIIKSKDGLIIEVIGALP